MEKYNYNLINDYYHLVDDWNEFLKNFEDFKKIMDYFLSSRTHNQVGGNARKKLSLMIKLTNQMYDNVEKRKIDYKGDYS